MSSPIILRHFDAARFDLAAELLAGLHPVDETQLRDVFAKVGGSFDSFWDLAARTRAVEILTGDRNAVRRMLAAALMAIAGREAWRLPHGLAIPIHAIVGIDPRRFQALYRLSGGPPQVTGMSASGASGDLARVLDARIDTGMDVEIPVRFAPEPGEPGLQGAWGAEALSDLLPLLQLVDTREKVETSLSARERGWWARLSGEPQRCAELRRGIDAAWADWATVLEAVLATHAGDGYLGLETS